MSGSRSEQAEDESNHLHAVYSGGEQSDAPAIDWSDICQDCVHLRARWSRLYEAVDHVRELLDQSGSFAVSRFECARLLADAMKPPKEKA